MSAITLSDAIGIAFLISSLLAPSATISWISIWMSLIRPSSICSSSNENFDLRVLPPMSDTALLYASRCFSIFNCLFKRSPYVSVSGLSKLAFCCAIFACAADISAAFSSRVRLSGPAFLRLSAALYCMRVCGSILAISSAEGSSSETVSSSSSASASTTFISSSSSAIASNLLLSSLKFIFLFLFSKLVFASFKLFQHISIIIVAVGSIMLFVFVFTAKQCFVLFLFDCFFTCNFFRMVTIDNY